MPGGAMLPTFAFATARRPGGRRLPRRLLTLLIGSALVAAMSPVTAAAGPPGTTERAAHAHIDGSAIDDTLSLVGSVPRVPGGVTIDGLPIRVEADTGMGMPIVSPATGKIYQVYSTEGDRAGVIVRDGGSLAIVDKFLLPPAIMGARDFAFRGELAHAADPARKRIFFWLDRSGNGNFAERRVLILDEQHPSDPLRTKVVELGTTPAKTLEDADLPTTSDINELNEWRDDYLQGEFIDWKNNELDPWREDPVNNPPPSIPPPLPDPTTAPLPTPGVPNPGNIGDPTFLDTGIGPAPNPMIFQGITYLDDKLYLILGSTGTVTDPPQMVLLFELGGGPTLVRNDDDEVIDNPDLLEPQWVRPVRSCRTIGPGEFVTSQRWNGFAPVLKTADALYVPCGASNTSVVVRMPLAEITQFGGSEQVFTGTGVPMGFLVDHRGQRIHFRVQTQLGAAVLTFDATEDAYVGLQAVTAIEESVPQFGAWGLDPDGGRIFTQTPKSNRVVDGKVVPDFGLGLTSGRFTPVQPPVTYPQFHRGPGAQAAKQLAYNPIHRRLLLPDKAEASADLKFIVLHDEPPPEQPDPDDPDALTNDIDEREGQTGVAFSGNTSGYGVRELLVGGLAGLVPNRAIDAPAGFRVYEDAPLCQRADREIILARVENAKLDNSVQAALARPAQLDGETRQDLRTPSRCTEKGHFGSAETTLDNVAGFLAGLVDDLREEVNCSICFLLVDQLIGTVNGATGVGPPGLPREVDDLYPDSETREQLDQLTKENPDPFDDAACRPSAPANSSGSNAGFPGAPILGGFRASVDCTAPTETRASATATPLGTSTPPRTGVEAIDKAVDGALTAAPAVTVASSSTSARTFRDPKLGMVSEVVSVVRGISVALPGGGSLTIGGIYAEATTAAKGRPGTATTNYERVMWGVHAVTPSGEVHCELCANEDQMRDLADGLSRALGERGRVIVPELDADLAAGTPGGYQAGVQRDPFAILTNEIVQGDSMKDVPALEIVLFNDSLSAGRQRQIFQFAGVKANSQYGISCLGGGEVQGNECVLPPRPPSSLTVSLTDEAFAPLAGGTFSIGTNQCTTAANGQCTMLDIPAGSYTIRQTAVPEGFLPAKDFPIQLTGSARTVSFLNQRNAASIVITLHDSETGQPLLGGYFHVVSDTNADQLRGPTDPLVASCVTDATGACPFVDGSKQPVDMFPLGDYVVHEVQAPDGYQPADPVGFALDQPGQVAELAFTNGVEATAVLSLGGGRSTPAASVVNPAVGPDGFFGPIAEGLRWLARNFWQMLLLAASATLFGSPLWQSWRRRMLLSASVRPF